MLFLPSRMGRTSTMPPPDKPEASRHHLGSVPWLGLTPKRSTGPGASEGVPASWTEVASVERG